MLWQFRLAARGGISDAQADRLFDRAGDLCAEAVPRDGSVWVAFDREAPTLVDAVVSGVRDLDNAGIGIAAALDDDPMVTLEVVAERLGRPLRVVRGWAGGDFPAPVRPHPRRPVYRWPEVRAWAAASLPAGSGGSPPAGCGACSPDPGPTLEAVTLALRIRALAPRLERLAPVRSLLYP